VDLDLRPKDLDLDLQPMDLDLDLEEEDSYLDLDLPPWDLTTSLFTCTPILFHLFYLLSCMQLFRCICCGGDYPENKHYCNNLSSLGVMLAFFLRNFVYFI